MTGYTENHKPCANIRESDGEDDCDDLVPSRRSSSNCSRFDFDRFEYEDAMRKLMTPFNKD